MTSRKHVETQHQQQLNDAAFALRVRHARRIYAALRYAGICEPNELLRILQDLNIPDANALVRAIT